MRRISLGGFFSSDRGAVAIEYVLIAAILGLGLVAALVSTKGSLNSTYGKMATQVAAGVDGRTNSTTQGDYWASKTLVSNTRSFNGSGYTNVLNYSDGSQVTYANYPSSTLATQVTIKDTANNTLQYTYFDTSGNQNYTQTNYYNSSAFSQLSGLSYSYNPGYAAFSGNPPAPQNEYLQKYDANGAYQSQLLGAPTAAAIAQSQKGVEASLYFKSIIP